MRRPRLGCNLTDDAVNECDLSSIVSIEDDGFHSQKHVSLRRQAYLLCVCSILSLFFVFVLFKYITVLSLLALQIKANK